VGQELAVYTMAMGSRGLSESPVAGDEPRSVEDIAPTKHELAETTGGRMPEGQHTMNARITFSLFGVRIGVVDLAINLDGVLDIPDGEVTKTTQVTRRAVKGISRMWVRGMVT
jgi:hypothetical protein